MSYTYTVNTLRKGRSLAAKKVILAGSTVISEIPCGHIIFDEINSNYLTDSIFLKNLNSEDDVSNDPKPSIYRCYLAAKIVIYLASNPDKLNLFEAINGFEDYSRRDILLLQSLLANIYDREYPADLCGKTLRKVNSNSFTITDSEMKPTGLGFYMKASSINHSCDPNCYQTFVNNKLYIRAIRTISMNEEITISYIDIGKPLMWRQIELYDSYYFRCDCTRCTTNTDGELNGWKCVDRNCDGIMYPEDIESTFISWLQGVSTDSKILPITNMHTLDCLPLPCADILFPTLRSNVTLICKTCSVSTPISHISDKATILSSSFKMAKSLSAIAERSQNPNDFKNAIQEYQTLSINCTNWIPQAHFCSLDIHSSFSLVLLASNRFDLAYDVLKRSLLSYYYNYPNRHPLISLQELQLSKLAAYLFRDPSYALTHAHNALNSLKISHHHTHPIFEALNDVILSLSNS